MDRVVLRFSDGRVLKGYLESFSADKDTVSIQDLSGDKKNVNINELKAIFFVKTFEGRQDYNERKAFTGINMRLKRVFIKFKDGESLTGYVEGDMPWEKGFFLESGKKKGFFLIPTDGDSNNIKVFVVASFVRDVTLIG
ncbi:MAG: hypothetical protein N2257_05390 [Thermodesulfovibrionales bacterium]|nr:hypothetical protein [Thermodesulfovibrionales bacterium]